jgi:regulatory protein
VPRDAEAWLAARGIAREPVVGDVPGPDDDAGAAGPSAPLSVREAVALARQSAADARMVEPVDARAGGVPSAGEADPDGAPDGSPLPGESPGTDVAAALAFVRRSASAAPQSEGRLRDKLAERGIAGEVADEALARARAERLVDDVAMIAALVEERRAKGHAVARVRRDLVARGFVLADVERALVAVTPRDPEAEAFALAGPLAARHRGVEAETAYRRVLGHLLRLGHPEGLARKVARTAVFADREAERTAGR